MAELLDIATRLAGLARPGEQVEAYVAWHRDTDVRAYGGEVESLSSAESSGVGLRVVASKRQGFAYVGSLEARLAEEALAEARDNATFSTPDDHAGLAEPDGVVPEALELFDDGLSGVPISDKVALALDLEAATRALDPRVRQVVSADYGDGVTESAIATSTGIAVSSRRTTCYLGVDVVAGDGEETQTGDGYSVGRGFAELDASSAARDAVLRATRLLGARKPPSAQLDVVLDRRVTATLLAVLASTLSGEEVAKGRSLFAGRLGEEVGVAALTLADDPTDPAAFGAAPYDAEGLASRRNLLIEAGRLSGFLYDSYSARRAGTRSTASAVRAGFKSTPGVGARALSLVPGEMGQEAVIDLVGDGLFVQGVTGVHSGVNPVSGDFSVGAVGLLIRGGELAEPVREVTIASTIQRMLQQVLAVGSDVERLPGVASGVSLAIGGMSMSGG